MNILIFSWRGPGHPNAGGAEISTHEHAKEWARAGHDVTLFTSSYVGSKKKETVDGVSIIREGHQVFGVHLKGLRWYLFGKHKRYDLVIDQFHGIPFFTPLFVRAKKLAFIHEVAKEVWWLNSWQKPLNLIPAILGTIFEPLVFRFFYRNVPFMTVSQSTKKDLIGWGIAGRDIKVIHNGVNIPKVEITAKEKRKTLIFLGALSKDKGIEDAIKVFSKIAEKKTNFQFWVVGKSDPEYLKFLKKGCKDANIQNKVKFWGYVWENKKFELLSKAHVLINPSIREGWGLVVIEAAAVGTPTVAFDVPGLRDSIIEGKTGLLCSKNTVDDLVENILELVENKQKYLKMRREAISYSRNFSWKKAGQESLKFIEAIVK
ncbi:hypothetical protein A3B45_03545 [Candidatus Daviesbacteria bacterium RIFCSPLOWO2_01_FULL_39_12]|uniref:Glycosyl transferase family 1 domain-containing protein n=1 Tax=Candidatus Daviesbacteria bacterium RIFCSPLOWO2_01_FULL_39_12 TaxID=1797785 RepID=A0A1F5KL31_9BACT|nr:MAG: hypothetical protein A3B45_03545 [Candidatus Daviesbacteria bacterium RIFCSPLOWO2_01_FULL_39_12]